MSGDVRVVVFDLGNVIIRWDRAMLFREFYPDPADLDRFLTDVYSLEANDRLDRGQPLAQFTAELADAHPEHRLAIEALATRWVETIGDPITGAVELLIELAEAEVPVYALSNWNAGTFALVQEQHPFFGCFDGIVLSGNEGITKPDPAIFTLVGSRYGFEMHDALFVDDTPANVAAAEAVGMQAVVFRDPPQLRADLRARGFALRSS